MSDLLTLQDLEDALNQAAGPDVHDDASWAVYVRQQGIEPEAIEMLGRRLSGATIMTILEMGQMNKPIEVIIKAAFLGGVSAGLKLAARSLDT